jgi:hypothetical protein
MRAFPGSAGVDLNTVAGKNAAFRAAVRSVAARVGATRVNLSGTPMPAFKAQYAALLNRVRAGAVEVLTDGRQRFVILDMDQVLALTSNAGRRRKVTDVFASLPTVPASVPRLRAISIATPSSYRFRDGAPLF